MALTEDIAWVGRLLDDYAAEESRRAVASGVPAAMQVGQIDAEGWVEWRVLPSTLKEAEVTGLESKFGIQLPPLFRAYLLARFQLFDQVTSRRYDQLILMSATPAGNPLAPLVDSLSAWRPLIEAGFIPFAEWGDSWGPMCFDSGRRAPDGDCPVVWMDHEVFVPLGDERWRVRAKMLPLAQPLYESCRDLLLDIFGSAASKITGANAGGPPRLPLRRRWAARIAQFFR